MLVYHFKVSLDYDKRVYRQICILANQTLADLHKIIFSVFDRYDEHMYSFYLTGKPVRSIRARYKAPEFTSPYAADYSETANDASKTTIDMLQLKEKSKFYYLFDFGDCWWHEITLLSVTETNHKLGYPRIVKKVGESPDQYPDYEDED